MKFITKKNIILFLIIFNAFVLRIYKLDQVPVALHGDELGVGYNAYTMITSGLDEYGKFWPISFRADVTPLIFYTTIPLVAIFGLTEFATRLPSVVVGTVSVFLLYFFAYELFRHTSNQWIHKNISKLSLLSAWLLSIIPWHVQISRIVHDGSYGLLLQLAATIFFLRFQRLKKSFFLYCSFTLFALSFYSYHAPRLTSPLLLACLCLIFYKTTTLYKKQFILGFLLFVITIIPFLLDLLSKPLADTRFGGINIFIRETPQSTFLDIPLKLVVNFFKQYDPRVLFSDTSMTRYFYLPSVGLLYLINLPLILLGVSTTTKDKKIFLILLSWTVISVLPGALTLGIVNGGRIFTLVISAVLFSALGILFIMRFSKYASSFLITILFMLSFSHFANIYLIKAPLQTKLQWQYGAKEILTKVSSYETSQKNIVVSDKIKQGYIYVLFYNQKSLPWLFSQDLHRHPFIGYDKIGKYEFRMINWSKDKTLANTIIVGTPEDIPEEQFIDRIYDSNGHVLYGIAKTNL